MTHTDEFRPLARVLALVFCCMLLVMSAYEFTKQLLIPGITVWESHVITIFFTSVIAIVLVFFPLRSFHREHQRTVEGLRLRKEAEEKLRRSEMQYRSFVESVEDSIYTVDSPEKDIEGTYRRIEIYFLIKDAMPEYSNIEPIKSIWFKRMNNCNQRFTNE